MEWYLPFTLLSGVGLLVLSTSNFIGGLNNEISQMEQDAHANHPVIIRLKLDQLKLLSIAIALQYGSLFLFTLSSLLLSFVPYPEWVAKGITLLGVLLVSIALAMLITFAFRAISIRQKHLKTN